MLQIRNTALFSLSCRSVAPLFSPSFADPQHLSCLPLLQIRNTALFFLSCRSATPLFSSCSEGSATPLFSSSLADPQHCSFLPLSQIRNTALFSLSCRSATSFFSSSLADPQHCSFLPLLQIRNAPLLISFALICDKRTSVSGVRRGSARPLQRGDTGVSAELATRASSVKPKV
jgi:hypothetical protein